MIMTMTTVYCLWNVVLSCRYHFVKYLIVIAELCYSLVILGVGSILCLDWYSM